MRIKQWGEKGKGINLARKLREKLNNKRTLILSFSLVSTIIFLDHAFRIKSG